MPGSPAWCWGQGLSTFTKFNALMSPLTSHATSCSGPISCLFFISGGKDTRLCSGPGMIKWGQGCQVPKQNVGQRVKHSNSSDGDRRGADKCRHFSPAFWKRPCYRLNNRKKLWTNLHNLTDEQNRALKAGLGNGISQIHLQGPGGPQ